MNAIGIAAKNRLPSSFSCNVTYCYISDNKQIRLFLSDMTQ